MTTSSNRDTELNSNDEDGQEGSLPGSAAGVAGLIAPDADPELGADSELADEVAPPNPQTSDRRPRAQPSRRVWWPIALLLAIVAGVIIVSAARPGHDVRGTEPEPGSHGAEKLPEKTPGSTPESTR